jgi:peptide/nickel transport system permease protein
MRAARYVEHRLLHAAFLLAAVSLVAFAGSQLAPGNFLDELKLNPQVSTQTVAALRAQYGLDQPLNVRYFRWLKSVAAGDLGYSLAYNLPVKKLLWTRMRNTVFLGVAAMWLAWAFALPLGVYSACRHGSWMDHVLSGASTLLLGTPELALGLFFIVIAANAGMLPTGGMTSAETEEGSWRAAGDILHHLILPTMVLALAALPVLFRHIRQAILETWDSPFVQAAKGHGIRDTRLLLHHALPAAANPLISLFGLSLAGLVSGSFLVEIITGWPGLGPLFLESVYARDFQVVVAIVMLFSVFLILANLVADLLLYTADPRVRAEC